MATVQELQDHLGTLAVILWNYGAEFPVPTLDEYSDTGKLGFSLSASLPGADQPGPATIKLSEIWEPGSQFASSAGPTMNTTSSSIPGTVGVRSTRASAISTPGTSACSSTSTARRSWEPRRAATTTGCRSRPTRRLAASPRSGDSRAHSAAQHFVACGGPPKAARLLASSGRNLAPSSGGRTGATGRVLKLRLRLRLIRRQVSLCSRRVWPRHTQARSHRGSRPSATGLESPRPTFQALDCWQRAQGNDR